MIGINELYLGDCLELMKQIEDKSIDCIITSPPYNKKSNNRKPHKSDTWSGGNSAISYISFNDNMNESEYQEWQIKVINECIRVLKPKGSFFYNHKNRTVDKCIISPLEWILKSKAFLKEEIIWDRRMIVEVDKVRFYPKTEKIYWLIKEREQPFFNGEYAKLTDIWNITPTQKEKRHNHPAPFPIEIPQNCILATTNENDIILDPFIGSGTTAIACINTNRNFIGIEKELKYYDLANERINNHKAQLKLL